MKRYAYSLMTVLLCSGALLVLSALYVTVPMLHVVSTQFQVSVSSAALSVTVFSSVFAFGCLLYGPLSSVVGRKRVMTAGAIGLALTTLLTYTVNDFTTLLVLRGLQGATASSFSPVALTYVGEMFPASRKVTVIGYISTGFLLSGLFGQIVSSMIVHWAGWEYVFLYFGLLYACLAVGFITALPEAPRVGIASQSFQAICRNRSLLLCYSITLTVLLCFVGTYSALEYRLTAPPYELSFHEMLAIRALGLLGMLLCPFAGKWCSRYGMQRVLTVGLLLSILGLLLLSFVHHIYSYATVSIIFVAGIALVVPSLIALIGEHGDSNRALATSLYTFILFIGASLGPLIAIYIVDRYPANVVYLCFAAVLIASMICALLVKEPSEHRSASHT